MIGGTIFHQRPFLRQSAGRGTSTLIMLTVITGPTFMYGPVSASEGVSYGLSNGLLYY